MGQPIIQLIFGRYVPHAELDQKLGELQSLLKRLDDDLDRLIGGLEAAKKEQ